MSWPGWTTLSKEMMGTAVAKATYFLTPADLRLIQCHSYGGGIGCGPPMHFYKETELRALALRKHGQAGFHKKQQARLQRESKKRQRQDDADSALAALQRASRPPAPMVSQHSAVANNSVILVSDSDNAAPLPAAAAPRPAAIAPPETSVLRKSLLKLAKQALGFKDSGAPKQWRVEVPGIQPSVFAALAGRPADAELRTFVKAGAYYSHEGAALELFQCTQEDLERFFSHEGVGIEIYHSITLKYKPLNMTLTLHGSGEIVY